LPNGIYFLDVPRITRISVVLGVVQQNNDRGTRNGTPSHILARNEGVLYTHVRPVCTEKFSTERFLSVFLPSVGNAAAVAREKRIVSVWDGERRDRDVKRLNLIHKTRIRFTGRANETRKPVCRRKVPRSLSLSVTLRRRFETPFAPVHAVYPDTRARVNNQTGIRARADEWLINFTDARHTRRCAVDRNTVHRLIRRHTRRIRCGADPTTTTNAPVLILTYLEIFFFSGGGGLACWVISDPKLDFKNW